MRGLGNLGNMGGMASAMKQVQKAMEQQQRMQDELANEVLEGSAGGGMVVAQVSGLGKIVGIKIDPQVVDPEDVEMLEDLVLTAVREATDRSEDTREERQKQLLGGLGLPPGMLGG